VTSRAGEDLLILICRGLSVLAWDAMASPSAGEVDILLLGPIPRRGPMISVNPSGGVLPRIRPLIRAADEGDQDGTIMVEVPVVFSTGY
ncbi:MAG: hypothetical protein ACKPKO_36780, partial [Candidatus Fonsibacter sp.]